MSPGVIQCINIKMGLMLLLTLWGPPYTPAPGVVPELWATVGLGSSSQWASIC